MSNVTDVETTADNRLPSGNESSEHAIPNDPADRDPPQSHGTCEDSSNTLPESPDQSSDIFKKEKEVRPLEVLQGNEPVTAQSLRSSDRNRNHHIDLLQILKTP